jgi:hypothetical protein
MSDNVKMYIIVFWVMVIRDFIYYVLRRTHRCQSDRVH